MADSGVSEEPLDLDAIRQRYSRAFGPVSERLRNDVLALVAEVDRLRTEPPNDEPSKAEIEAGARALQRYDVGDENADELSWEAEPEEIRLQMIEQSRRVLVAARRVRTQPPTDPDYASDLAAENGA